MIKSWLAFILSLTMTLTLRCQTSSAAPINLKPKVCLDRDAEEKFVICFEQNLMCHEALRKMAKEPKNDVKYIALAVFAGLISGALIESKLKH